MFGQEDEWILIQYAINSEHYRFGYIPAKALPKKTNVKRLDFVRTDAYTSQTVSITDDPLYSCTAISTLPEDCAVTWLATMGDWAYVEYQGDAATKQLRGFVPAASLRMLSRGQACSIAQDILLASSPITEMQPVTRVVLQEYTVTAVYDANTGVWSVRFDSGRDYDYTVFVDDKTGGAHIALADNG